MQNQRKKEMVRFLVGFSALYVLSYFLIGTFFLHGVSMLPEKQRAALDFFQVYSPAAATVIVSQLIRGLVIAAVCYSLRETLRSHPKATQILVGLLWGVHVFGSVEPVPGSFEGMIYTVTTPLEHFLVVAASLVQMTLLAWAFNKWMGYPLQSVDHKNRYDRKERDSQKFVLRFMILHVITYFFVGVLFYQMQGYQASLDSMEIFTMWRDLNDPMVAIGVFTGTTVGQVFRGLALAVFLLPFRSPYTDKKSGGVLLFSTMWGLTFLTAVGIISWMVDSLIGEASLGVLLVGSPEVTVQMIVFSMLLYRWESRKKRKKKPIACRYHSTHPA